MDMRFGLLFLFVLGATWACNARELVPSDFANGRTVFSDVSGTVLQIDHKESEREVQALEEVRSSENVCTICEEFAAKALEYLAENKTQTEIIGILHKTCSRMLSFKEQCKTLVDYYTPLFFLEIASEQPGCFCQKVNLCGQMAITSPHLSQDSCEICQYAVEEVLLKLKNPNTQLEIIELLLKGCDAVESYVKKCKTLVFEYAPLLFTDAEKFLETTDICSLLHACNLPTASKQSSPILKTSLLSES